MSLDSNAPVPDEISRMIAHDKATAQSLSGTYLFDGNRARMNPALNRMCMSLTRPANRAAFSADPEGYCHSFGLSQQTVALVTARDWLGLIRCGGNIYYVFKLAAIDHISMQHVGAQQNSMTLEQFRNKLNSARDGDHG